jgi:hypothetical protein
MDPKLLAILLVAAMCSPAQSYSDSNANRVANDPNAPMLFFSAFGTAGIVDSSEDRANFVFSVFTPNGAAYTRPWSTDVDCIVGTQVPISKPTCNYGHAFSRAISLISSASRLIQCRG